ncbi:LemA family protein [bacterium]|nr:LemA family protein [candidate division CSSED10-310 bacterium]
MSVLIAILVIAAFILGVFAIMYNSLVGRKNQAENAFAGMDAQLKKRYDLIPNLVASVKHYMTHEKTLLEDITEMRAKAVSGQLGPEDRVDLENKLTKALGGIMVAVENYPNLKANENFMHLQRSLNEVEEQISAARRAYNSSVMSYNNAVEMFPTNLVAGIIGYRRKKMFEIPESERGPVDVGAMFN